MQSLLNTIADLMQEKNLPGLMIGGHAVTALGHPRATFDLDLLIPRHAAQAWRVALAGLRYSLFAESDNFHQYEAPVDFPLPPIDLRLVDEDVFTTLEIAKTATKPIAVPSVQAMIALTLHAAKQSTRTEGEKHWSDIIALFKAHQLRLEEVTIHAMVLRHGGAVAINRIQASLAGGN